MQVGAALSPVFGPMVPQPRQNFDRLGELFAAAGHREADLPTPGRAGTMAVMSKDHFRRDPVLRRAAGYPYDITRHSFTLVGGAEAPFDRALTKGRYPVIGYGSNQSPVRLRQKYGTAHAPIPVQRAQLADHDVAYSAHFATYGSLPAALRHVEGTTVSVAVNWLDDAQLETMHPTELDNYHFVRLTDITLRLAEGETLREAYVYLSFRGHVGDGDEAFALAEVAADNRRHRAVGQLEALALMRDRMAPGEDLTSFVRAHIADADVRSARVRQLMAAAVTVRHAAHEVVLEGFE